MPQVKDLNKGTFGFVQLARVKATGELVAVKFIERGDRVRRVLRPCTAAGNKRSIDIRTRTLRQLPTALLGCRGQVTKYVEREILNHRLLRHPHIIKFREVFLTPQHLAIAMEYAPGGDTFEYVVKRGGLREDEARWFFQQLIVCLDYCHRLGVVNRDIKLENTLLDSSPRPLVKICDFGYSKVGGRCTPAERTCMHARALKVRRSRSKQLLAAAAALLPMCRAGLPPGPWPCSCPRPAPGPAWHLALAPTLPMLAHTHTMRLDPQHEGVHSAPHSKVGTSYYVAPEVLTCVHEYDGKVRHHAF